MKKEQITLMRELRSQGKTCQLIADECGCTRQYVSMLTSQKKRDKPPVRKCVYPGLRKWMIENDVGLKGIIGRMDVKQRCSASTMSNVINGKTEPNKVTIDAILAVTGLTYEQCFGGVDDG